MAARCRPPASRAGTSSGTWVGSPRAGTTVLEAGGATVTGGTATWALGTVNGADAGERRLSVRVDDLGAADPLVRVARAVLASGANAARAAAVTPVEPAAALDLV